MEKPDANGFVNITWPSRNIPHGGIFHTRVVEPSAERQEFLKVLLEESKLSIAQRQRSDFALRQEERRDRTSHHRDADSSLVRPRTSRRRSLSAIRDSGVFVLEPYKPMKRGEDREKLKERLANTMAYGDSPVQAIPMPQHTVKPKPKLPSNKEQWNDLLTQIRERAEWLAEMEDLGQAEPHRDIIKDQIAERLRALDALGIDSACTSARSGFSTLRSKEVIPTTRSIGSAAKSEASQKTTSSKGKQKPPGKSCASHTKGPIIEENVAAYGKFSPLQYTPRRRV